MRSAVPRPRSLLGAACLTAGCLWKALARAPWEWLLVGVLRNCAGFYTIPGLTTLLRLTPGHNRFAYCTYLTLVYGGQVVVEPVGALVAFNPTWRALFVALSACGACLVLMALFLFPDDRPPRQPEHGFHLPGP